MRFETPNTEAISAYCTKALWCYETQTNTCPMQFVVSQISTFCCAPTENSASGRKAVLERTDSHRMDCATLQVLGK